MIITWSHDGDRADLIADGACLLQIRYSGDLRPGQRGALPPERLDGGGR